jgi:hypothetical protein
MAKYDTHCYQGSTDNRDPTQDKHDLRVQRFRHLQTEHNHGEEGYIVDTEGNRARFVVAILRSSPDADGDNEAENEKSEFECHQDCKYDSV